MGTFSGSTAVSELAIRLRDTANTGYSRTDVVDILDRCQCALNARLGLVMTTATFTTTAAPLYDIDTITTNPAVVRVVQVRDGNRELYYVPWANLVHQDPQWIRRRGPQAEMWSRIGRDTLVITPQPTVPATLTIVFVRQTTLLTDTGTTIDIPDEYYPLLLDLAESVLLFRAREWAKLDAVLQRVAVATGIEIEHQMDRRHGSNRHE